MCLNREFTMFARQMLSATMVILSVSSLQVQASDVATTETATNSIAGNSSRAFNFPGWPERSLDAHRERIPLAPPGPYMSSALSEYSFDGSSFSSMSDRDTVKREINPDNSSTWPNQGSNQGFSYDMPWPHNSGSGRGYQPSYTNLPDNHGPGATTGPSDKKWPDYNWPAWPDDHRSSGNVSNNGGVENTNLEHTNPDDTWPPKWPHVNRRDDEWPRKSWRQNENRSEERLPEPVWPGDKWQDNKWPGDNWSQSR